MRARQIVAPSLHIFFYLICAHHLICYIEIHPTNPFAQEFLPRMELPPISTNLAALSLAYNFLRVMILQIDTARIIAIDHDQMATRYFFALRACAITTARSRRVRAHVIHSRDIVDAAVEIEPVPSSCRRPRMDR